MRVLVTGAAGQVGSAIARRLGEAGHEVVGLGRTPPAGDHPAREWIAEDLAAPGLAGRVTAAPCDAVVHAAASLGMGDHDLAASLVNGLGTQQVLALAERWRATAIVYLSSVPVIGTPATLPVTEEHPVAPPTAYHAAKLYGEHLVALAARRGVAAAALRLTSPVGPGTPDGRIAGVFVRRALAGEPLVLQGRGGRGQDYVDVRDVAGAVLACLRARASGVFNVAAGVVTSNLELAEACVAATGSASPIAFSGEEDPAEHLRWDVAIDRARDAFGYAPRRTLADSLRAMADELSAASRAAAAGPRAGSS